MEEVASNIVRFGLFQVDLRAGELRKGGLRIRLQEQPFQVLAALLEQCGEVVTREELRRRVWPAQTFVDFDRGLNRAVNKLRDALGDNAGNPRFIEAVSRRGYRFLAPLQRSQAAEAHTSGNGKVRLVVLPLNNLCADPDQEYFSDGLTEELIAHLGRLNPQKLGVIARTSAMLYKGSAKSVEQVGQELKVDYILEGSVRRAGSRVRITLQLIQVADQTHVWAESYDRELSDIIGIQNDVAGKVGEALACELLREYRDALNRAGTQHAAAHENYLRGRFLWNQRSESSITAAIACYEEALRQDSEYALAHAGLSNCYAMLSWFGTMAPREAAARARASASRAQELAPDLPESHCSLALVRFWFDWDWSSAEQCFRRALQLNPNCAPGHHWWGAYLAVMGRLDEAGLMQQRAQALDPLSLMIAKSAGDPYYYARQFERAIELYQAVLQREPRFAPAHFDLGRAQMQNGQYEAAIGSLKKALLLSGNREAAPALAHAYALAGERGEAMSTLEAVLQPVPGRYLASPPVALVYAALGEKEQAFAWLHRGLEERSSWLVFLQADPAYDPLRSDPRFAALLQRLGFAEAAAAWAAAD